MLVDSWLAKWNYFHDHRNPLKVPTNSTHTLLLPINKADSVSCWLTAALTLPVSWFHGFKVAWGRTQGPWESEHHTEPLWETQKESSDSLHFPHGLDPLARLSISSVHSEMRAWTKVAGKNSAGSTRLRLLLSQRPLNFSSVTWKSNTLGFSCNLMVSCLEKLDSRWNPQSLWKNINSITGDVKRL